MYKLLFQLFCIDINAEELFNDLFPSVFLN